MTQALITLTSEAIAHVNDMIAKKGPDYYFRMAIQETGCTGLMYVPSITKDLQDDDIAVPVDDSLIVYVDKQAVAAIKGTRIDYVSVSLGQKQLAYDNPNADSLCGCGESFNLKM